MSAALTAPHAALPDPSPDRSAQDDAIERTSRLLAVVRALIAFGRHLTQALLVRDPSESPVRLIRHFGVATVREIVARVARGLQLALALEARLALRLSKPVAVRAEAPARQRAPGAPRARRDLDADEPPPDPLPSVEEMARMIRHRGVEDVIVDICRDFGIAANHPLWSRIYDRLGDCASSAVRLVRVIVNRRHAAWTYAPRADDETVEAEFWVPALRLGTGPP